jgi:hypothetical protein
MNSVGVNWFGILSALAALPLMYGLYVLMMRSGNLVYQYNFSGDNLEIYKFNRSLIRSIHVSDVKRYQYKSIYIAGFTTINPRDDMYLSDTRRELLILELKSQKNFVVISPEKTEDLQNFLLKTSA